MAEEASGALCRSHLLCTERILEMSSQCVSLKEDGYIVCNL